MCDELQALGFTASYQTLTRQIRDRGLRPVCVDCGRATERANAVIPHPPGKETQWDWLDLPDPPSSWGWGSMAHLLVGSLAHSGRWRGYLSATMDQPHLVAGLDRICRGLGGLTQGWRFDRMATVCEPGSGRVTETFAGVAKYYGVTVSICPPRAGHRKGVVEKVNHTAAQRWWRTLTDMSVEQAQAECDRFAAVRGDTRMRRSSSGDGKATVATVAAREPLQPMPATPYPLQLTETRAVSRQALVAYRGNQYSVPPELAAATVTVTQRLDEGFVDIATTTGIVVARHRLEPDGAGVQVRDHHHVTALDAMAMKAAAATRGPHRRKERIPPGPTAQAAAASLRGEQPDLFTSTVIDLAAYEQAARGRNTLS